MNNQAGPKPQGDSVQRATDAAPVVNGRRRFVRGAASAVPVLLAVSGRSALAGGGGGGGGAGCTTVKGLSPMAWMSYYPTGGGTVRCPSHTVNPNTVLYSPGYWKPNISGKTFQGPWPNGIKPFETIVKNGSTIQWNASSWNSYSGLPNNSGWDSGTSASMLGDSRSFSRILLAESGNALIWHLCAAYLNAKLNEMNLGNSPSGYALTSDEVIAIANHSLMGSLSDSQLKAFLGQTWA